MRTIMTLLVIAVAIQSCRQAGKENQVTTDPEPVPAALDNADPGIAADTMYAGITDNVRPGHATEQLPEPGAETRLRYPSFSVVFHNFKGYETEEGDEHRYYLQFGNGDEGNEADLNVNEWQNEDYRETLIVKSDTLHLSETLDERINNTLIQILPGSRDDRFKVSQCYLANLNELFDHRVYSSEELGTLYEHAERFNEPTNYFPVKDSAGLYFRAMPHTPDMLEVAVVDGKVIPARGINTPDQLDRERRQLEEDVARIRKKYGLKDTLVVIPGEYSVTANLTKNGRLFDYSYESFLLRIERYRNNRLLETRYIVIAIAYGC